MAFKQEPQVFSTNFNTMIIGVGEKQVLLGGENVLPLYTFDAPIEFRPKVGVAISDMGHQKDIPGIEAFYSGAETVVDMAKRAATMPGADFLVLCLDSAHPNNGDKSIEECVAIVKEVIDSVDIPIVIEGSKHIEKDKKLLEKVAEAAQGKNVLILSMV